MDNRKSGVVDNRAALSSLFILCLWTYSRAELLAEDMAEGGGERGRSECEGVKGEDRESEEGGKGSGGDQRGSEERGEERGEEEPQHTEHILE